MNVTRFAFGILLAVFVLAVGCAAPKPKPDPLAGWKTDLDHAPDRAITDDFRDYTNKLSLEFRNGMGPILYLEDGTGQHAITFETGRNGTSWKHVLIYDRDDKRIKVIKYVCGHYAS